MPVGCMEGGGGGVSSTWAEVAQVSQLNENLPTESGETLATKFVKSRLFPSN